MATATKQTETIKVPITTYKTEVRVTGVTLKISEEEAQTLRNLLGHVNVTIPHLAAIRSALSDAGFLFQYFNHGLRGNIDPQV